MPKGLFGMTGLVFSVALAVRLPWALWATVTPVSDFAGYRATAQQWLATGEFDGGLGRAYRTPGYPALLVAIEAVCGPNLHAIAVTQAVIGSAAAALTTLLAARWLGRRTAFLAGLLWALSPVAIAYTPVLASENLAAPLLLLTLLALEHAAAHPERRAWAGGAGVVAGLLVLTRPAAVFMWPALALLALYAPRARRWRPRACLAFSAMTFVALAPWFLRNAWLDLGPFRLSTQGGAGLWWGNNPCEQTGNGDGRPPVADLAADELERDDRAGTRAAEWIGAHPGRYLGLCGVRLARFFGKEPDWVAARHLRPTVEHDRNVLALWDGTEPGGVKDPVAAARGRSVVEANRRWLRHGRVMFAPLVLVGLALSLARWREFAYVHWPLAAYVAGLSLTVFDPRYRLLVGPLPAIVVAALVSDLVRSAAAARTGAAGRWKLALAGAAIATSLLVHAARLDRGWYRLPPTTGCACLSAGEPGTPPTDGS
jgi:hypothetical protein